MANLIATPLPIVYIDEKRRVYVLEGIDSSRCNDIYGIQVPVMVDYHIRTVFVNKVNGPNLNFYNNALEHYNLNLAHKPAIGTTVGWREFSAREHLMCVRDLMSLKSTLPLFNATIAALRSNGIAAEEMRDGMYWALGDDAWRLWDSGQIDLCNENLFHPYSVDMRGNTPWFECVTDYVARRSRTTIEDDTPYCHVRSCYMLDAEPETMKNPLILKVIAGLCGCYGGAQQPENKREQEHISRVIDIEGD